MLRIIAMSTYGPCRPHQLPGFSPLNPRNALLRLRYQAIDQLPRLPLFQQSHSPFARCYQPLQFRHFFSPSACGSCSITFISPNARSRIALASATR